MNLHGKIRVLVVDDSAVARELISRGLSSFQDLEVAGTASDAWVARDKIVLLKPDVVTLDIEMPKMDGIEFLAKLLPQYPIPVIIVSGVTPRGSERALSALKAGAVEIVAKPSGRDPEGLAHMLGQLAERIREVSRADMTKFRKSSVKAPLPVYRSGAGNSGKRLIAIGASTGGTNVLNQIIPQFPQDMPPVLVVQHMPPVFTRMFAETLDKMSAVTVREAKDGDEAEQGVVLIAPGDFHLRVTGRGERWKVTCSGGDKVSGHRPSVDVLFDSVAEAAGDKATGLLLTGMGADGAKGLLHMRQRGARCFAQNEESSVVFGMPGEAWKRGAAERLLDIPEMTAALIGISEKTGSYTGRSAVSQPIR